MTTLELQRRLKALGYDPGPTDGIAGPLTIRAVKDFQADRGLVVDGIAGPVTQAALADAGGGGFPPSQPSPARGEGEGAPRKGEGGAAAPWFAEAMRLKGTREAAGAADNPAILRWAERLDLAYADDSVAWCGLFVAHCIDATLPDETLPQNPLGARNWLGFGKACAPTKGAVLVFWRGAREGWAGHVGFCAGADHEAFHVLGGNQSDAVTIARVAKNRLLGARWPKTAPLPTASPLAAAIGSAGLSINEA